MNFEGLAMTRTCQGLADKIRAPAPPPRTTHPTTTFPPPPDRRVIATDDILQGPWRSQTPETPIT